MHFVSLPNVTGFTKLKKVIQGSHFVRKYKGTGLTYCNTNPINNKIPPWSAVDEALTLIAEKHKRMEQMICFKGQK